MDCLSRVHSDHCPLLIHCGADLRTSTNWPFKFMAAWAEHPAYKDLVENAWRNDEEDVLSKLQRVRQESIEFNEQVFGNIYRRKRRVEARLKGVQRELSIQISYDLVQFEAQLQNEYRNVMKQEELLWYQKARDNRVRLGDRNTSYFHTQAVIRGKRKRVHRLKLLSGDWCDDPSLLEHEAQNYFSTLFVADPSLTATSFPHEAFPQLSAAACEHMERSVDKEEVRRALMSIKSFTTPGSDGFQHFFYKKYWHQVGDDFVQLVSQAFESGEVNTNLMETMVDRKSVV